MRAAGRRQQYDWRRIGIDSFAVLDEREIVDPAALERDRAYDARGLDGHTRRRGKRGFAGHRGSGRGLAGRLRCRLRSGRRAGLLLGGWRLRRGRGLLGALDGLLLLLKLLLLLRLRPRVI